MGIVCHCPNGHRVKVKDAFAGKRGLCPTCGEKFSIPAAGPQDSSPSDQPAEPQLPLARFVPLDPAVIVTLPRAVPWGAAREAADAATPPEVLPEAPARSMDPFDAGEDQGVPAPNEAVAPPLHPAIADRPDLAWRIAYPGGEASEPVDAVTMQEWLTGGQAEGSELVWRADWAGWLPVRGVFPEFFPAG